MTATAGAREIRVPDIGDFGEVPVIEVLVAVGDTVAAEDALITLESDKATMDVPSPTAGTVRELLVSVGDKVSEGSTILLIEPSEASDGPSAEGQAEASPRAPAQAEPPRAAQVQRPPDAPAPAASPLAQSAERTEDPPAVRAGSNGGPVYASPSVRRLARELGVDLKRVAGSGRKGRIVADDVRAAERNGSPAPGGGEGLGPAGLALAPWPSVDFEKFGPVERVERSRIQRLSGAALARNWVMIPHVTHNDDADITALEDWRRQLNVELGRDGIKLTMVSFLIAACVATLKAFPTFNASLDGEDLVLRRYYNIGFAADTPRGLVVPVIRDADGKGLLEIARELTTLSESARAGKLTPAEMSGGTFTISSLGGIGGTSFTPIINAPEVAILGVTRAALKPVWADGAGAFAPRLMLPLSLSYDHRVIDGAAAARFVAHLAAVLGDMRRILL